MDGRLDDTVAVLQALGSPDAVGISVDMTDPASIAAGFREVGDRWGSLNVLVHTIGPGAGRFDDLDDAGWDEAFALGTMSAVRSVREAVPLLRAAEWARVAIFSAHSIQRQSPMLVAYTASKAAVTSLAKNLAKSLAPDGILVNVVCPGSIVTASFTENLERSSPPRVLTRPTRTTSCSGSARRSNNPPTSGGRDCPTRSRPLPPTSCPGGTAT